MSERVFLAQLTIAGVELRVESVRGRLALGERFAIAVIARTGDDGPAAAADLLGQTFSLLLTDPHGTELTLGGIVSSVERTVGFLEGSRWELVLAPHAEALAIGADCRGFQDKTVLEIAEEVLGAGSVPFEVRCSGSYAPRPWTVQYRESDWSFLSRLFAEEGIVHVVESTDDSGKMLLLDDTTTVEPIEGGDAIDVRSGAGFAAPSEALEGLGVRAQVTSGAVVLRDYDPAKPRVKLESKATAEGEDLEVYRFRGRFDEPAVGDQRARRALEAARSRRTVVHGSSGGLRLRPGRFMTPSGSGSDALDRALLVIAVDIDLTFSGLGREAAGETGGVVRFEAIPKEEPFRLPPSEGRVGAGGPQTAVVVGPSGQEIHPDDQGRIRTQFRWDRLGQGDDKASVWQRVGQFPLGGSMIHPRVGWDVLCHFEEGDLDRPFILSHLYDGEHPVPYALPANKTRTAWQTATTPGGGSVNEIRFEDAAGSEEIFVNASLDQNVVVANDAQDRTGVDETRDVGGNETITVGSNEKLVVGSNQDVSVGGSETATISGKRTVEIGGSESISIGGSRTALVALGQTIDAKGGRSLSVGGSMIGASASDISRSTLGSATVTVGGAVIQATADGVSEQTLGACSETIGGAKIQASGASVQTTTKGALAETVGGAYIVAAGGNVGEASTGTLRITVGGAFIANAPTVTFEADSKISIRAGAATMVITSSSVKIKAPAFAHNPAVVDTGGSTVEHN